jgi:hypothetical protein
MSQPGNEIMKTRTTSSMLTKVIVPLRDSLSRSARWCGILLIPLVLASFALSPTARAVDPPPDGGYPNGNTAEGEDALLNLTTGINNTAIGKDALRFNDIGSNNTANGWTALIGNTSGHDNTADGSDALSFNTTGSSNTASGAGAMQNYATGSNNTATGYLALFGAGIDFPATGSFNTANGVQALYSNTSGGSNTASGYLALFSNETGSYNTADGVQALFSNTIGIDNTANGNYSLYNNTTGVNNTADGLNALYYNTTGSNNIALGFSAGVSLTTGDNNIDIGHYGVAGESAKIRIGTKPTHKNTYIAGIYGVTVSRGIGVIIDNTGHLGTTTSSARFKDEIKPMGKASEAIHALKPVTFRYKKELDPEGIPQFGLVAEDVAKVNRELVAFDEEGKPYTVRYEAVNAMLLNEFLKEHRKVEEQVRANQEQQANIAELNSAVAAQRDKTKALEVMLAEQAAQIRKVSAQLAASDQSALRIVVNDQSTTR